MRLCYPTARHIICAYNLPGEKHHRYKGYCDDGEHGAGAKILQYLLDNNLLCRVIFVTRIYSGVKLGLIASNLFCRQLANV